MPVTLLKSANNAWDSSIQMCSLDVLGLETMIPWKSNKAAEILVRETAIMAQRQAPDCMLHCYCLSHEHGYDGPLFRCLSGYSWVNLRKRTRSWGGWGNRQALIDSAAGISLLPSNSFCTLKERSMVHITLDLWLSTLGRCNRQV